MDATRDTITGALDDAEGLRKGEGMLQAGVLARLMGGDAFAGGFLDYEHRITENISAVAHAELGVLPFTREVVGTGIAAVRIRF